MIKSFRRLICASLVLILSCTLFSACNKDNRDDVEPTKTDDTVFNETVEEQVLVDEAGVKVVLKELTYNETYGKGMILSLENNTIQSLMFDCKHIIVNDHMANNLFGELLVPGESKDMIAYLDTNLWEYIGINSVGEIVLQFDFYDSTSFDSLLKTDYIEIQTSEYDNMITEADFGGEKLYEGNGLTIYGRYAEDDDLFESAVLLYIQNDADVEYLLSAESVTINGVVGGNLVIHDVCEGRKSLFAIEFDKAELSEYGIDEIEEIELELEILDRTIAEIIDTTGVMTISVEE